MGLIKLSVQDATEMRFRKAAMETFGYSKGSLSDAADRALNAWCDQRGVSKEAEFVDLIEVSSGILSHVKKTSVELQHEIRELWGKHARR